MDLGTVIGLILAVVLVVGAIMLNGPITAFIDVPSLLIVAGGAIAAALISFPLGRVLKVFTVFLRAVFSKPTDSVANIRALVKLAEVARRDGILSLESQLANGDYDPFLARGLRMAIDGQDPAVIEAALEQEIEAVAERHGAGKALFDNFGKYAPAFGMIGTLIGLVLMLGNLSDLEALGPAMAVALITTFYGSFIANVFAMPIADKLAVRSSEEIGAKILLLKGIMSIQSGDNPRVVQQKLLAFLDPRQRAAVEAETQ